MVMLSIALTNVITSSILSCSAYALEIGEDVSGDNLGEISSDVLEDEYKKVKTGNQQGQNPINIVSSVEHFV